MDNGPIEPLLNEFDCQRLQIGVVGSGAVGGIFASALLEGLRDEPRVNVSLLVTERHLGPLRKDGLRIVSSEGEKTYQFRDVVSSPDQMASSQHIMILAVKSDRLKEALNFWKPVLTGTSWVCSLLNGVGNGSIMKRLLPGKRILDGCVYVGAHLVDPGVVCWEGGPRRLFCGDIGDETRNIDAFCELFRLGGVDAALACPVAEAIWGKYLFVSPVAVVTSLYSCTLRGILQDPHRLQTFRSLVRELLILARAEGLRLAGLSCDCMVAKLAGFAETTTSSLYRDLDRERRGEFDSLVEEVLRRAAARGLDLPVYRRCRRGLCDRYNLG